MKTLTIWILAAGVGLGALGVGVAWGAASPGVSGPSSGNVATPAVQGAGAGAVPTVAGVPGGANELAKTISQITGVAISPLLGTGAVGAWRYFETPRGQRERLPWFAQPWFWVPALVLVGLVFAKDALGPATPTALKKPMDVVEVLENKVSGLIAAGAFVPLVVGVLGASLPGTTGLDTLAGAGMAAATGSQWLNILLTPFAIVAFVVVFLLGHVINVLILLSPFTTVDTVLKLIRTAVLGTVVGTSFASPTVGAVWALGIILVGTVLAGWSFRLTWLGSVFIADVLSRRRRWFRPDPKSNRMFLSRDVGDAPLRTYGRIERDEAGALRFRYRPFLLGREQSVTLPEGEYCIGRGFIYADLLRVEGLEDTCRYGILPPRYKRHEETLTRVLGLSEPRDVGMRAVFAAIGELLGFGGRRGVAGPVRSGG